MLKHTTTTTTAGRRTTNINTKAQATMRNHTQSMDRHLNKDWNYLTDDIPVTYGKANKYSRNTKY